ncbi:MAG: protein kinase [Gemmatimonadetes bacterium]|nr:protein kinase [Gemmatimonadota bacterium]
MVPDSLRAAFSPRYELERLIGSGGSADVYLATDTRHARKVACKVLRADTTSELGAERFLREIEIAAALQHPNVLPVFDSGELGGHLFYVMPFVEGASLRDRLRQDGPLRWDDALRLMREVTDALSYAHRRGIMHRDIKPDNIMLIGDHAVVADFGIARAIEDARREYRTPDGLGVGTPEYMAPEQATGDSLDARCDVYSLGATLYEVLTGTPPYQGASAVAVLVHKSNDPVPTLRPRDENVPPHAGHAIQRSLAREVHERFTSVEEFLEALVVGDLGARAAAPRTRLRTIAVLPFQNLSHDPDDEYLSDGITDELIYSLSKIADLRVVGRATSFRFKGSADDIRLIGEQLRVGGIVTGGVRRAGDRIRVSAELIDTASGFEQWTERYDRQLTDVFEVQEELAHAIATSLETTVWRPETAPAISAPAGPAYQRFLRGRWLWNQRTEAGLLASVNEFREAVALDPRFAQAHAALAESYVTLALYGALAPAEALPAARGAIETALALPAAPAEALTARACIEAVYEWDWRRAEDDFRRAIVSNPASPSSSQWYAMNLLVPRGRFGEAREQLARSQAIDPLSPVVSLSVGLSHFYERDYRTAVATFDGLIERDPTFGVARMFLAQALSELGNHTAALGALAGAAQLVGESRALLAARGVLAARSGHPEGAREALAVLEARAATRYVSPVLIAQVQAALGDAEAAVSSIERAVALRASDLVWVGVRPVFDALRTVPRFLAAMEPLHLMTRSGPFAVPLSA